MTTETTKHGFQRCEFDDDTCENCNTDVKEIYFRPTVSSTEGQYWCMPCIKKEEDDNETYERMIEEQIQRELSCE